MLADDDEGVTALEPELLDGLAFVEPDSLLLEEVEELPEFVACDDEATELAGSDGVVVKLCSFELAV